MKTVADPPPPSQASRGISRPPPNHVGSAARAVGSRRILLAWLEHDLYGQQAIRGLAEHSKRFGPFHFTASDQGDINLHGPVNWADFDGMVVYRRFCNEQMMDPAWPPTLPIVSLETSPSVLTEWRVAPDHHAAGALAAEEFARRGYTHFAYCRFPSFDPAGPFGWDQSRLVGFSEVARRGGAEPFVYDPPKRFDWGAFAEECSGPLGQWVASLPKPVGILAANDMRARHVLFAAHAQHIDVPGAVALIGVDNTIHAETSLCGISSVELDGFRAGYMAMELLHQRIEGSARAPRTILIPPRRLVIRQSSDMLAIPDSEVAAAVRYIADHATSGIRVPHVVAAVSLSRRQLEWRFHAALHRSILQEIRSVQVRRAKLLLADPQVPLARVASAAGFGSAKAMSGIFHRITGTTPSAFRRASQRPDADNDKRES